MHVAHIITRMIIGGAQENTLLTCEDQFREHGDEVTLITGPETGPEGSLMERARRCGFRIIELDAMRRSIHPLRDWQSYRQLVRILRECRPDIVHTHSSKAGIVGRAAAAKAGIPVVHTIHGASFHRGQSVLASAVYRQLERHAAKWTDAFISVCDALTRQYVDARVAEAEQFTTVYSGMDVDAFLQPPRCREEVRDELGIRPEEVVVAKVARLFHLKGHEYLIRAAKLVVDRHPEVKFLLIGDGILRAQFEEQIAGLGISDRFILTGLVPPARIPELIHASDIVAHTSVWEGLARVLPQGLLAGRPVVSYDIDGAPEVVIDGRTGFLLAVESVDELAEALCRLIEDPALRVSMGHAGRELCREQFCHRYMTCRIRDVYQQVLTD